MVMYMNKYYEKLLKLSKKAERKNCVPVGAIIVENKKIISCGYNKKTVTNNPLDHAEIIAIKKACKKKKNWRLENCTLYVTMEPCNMCRTVIQEVRIKNIKYLIKNNEERYRKDKQIENTKIEKINEQMYENQYLKILQNFFKEKRTKY